MNLAAVRSVLGPPGDYTTGPLRLDGAPRFTSKPHDQPVPGKDRWRIDAWYSDSANITVISDQQGIVIRTIVVPVTKEQQTVFENLGWRAKRQWRKWFSSN